MSELDGCFDLRKYISEFGTTPSKEENNRIIELVKAGDKEAKNTLILYNGKYVLYIIAHNFPEYIKDDDILQQGLMGLMRAAEKFEPSTGNSFSTYATDWIKQHIKRYLTNCGYTIRIPAHIAQKLYKLRKLRTTYDNEVPENTDFKTYALSMLDITEEEYDVLLPHISLVRSINTPIGEGEHGEVTEIADMLSNSNIIGHSDDEEYNSVENSIENKVIEKRLDEILSEVLTEREKDVLCRRMGIYYGKNGTGEYQVEAVVSINDDVDDYDVDEDDPPEDREKIIYRNYESLESIGHTYNISRERVRQIEARALRQLRNCKYMKELKEYFTRM